MRRSLHRSLLHAGLCCGLALLAAGCSGRKGVLLATDPAGARVVVDGADSGFVTPCMLDLQAKNTVQVDFELPGYSPATRVLRDKGRTESVFWRDATVHYNTWNFPLWLTPEDFFVPVKFRGGKAPARVFVRLRREVDDAR